MLEWSIVLNGLVFLYFSILFISIGNLSDRLRNLSEKIDDKL